MEEDLLPADSATRYLATLKEPVSRKFKRICPLKPFCLYGLGLEIKVDPDGYSVPNWPKSGGPTSISRLETAKTVRFRKNG